MKRLLFAAVWGLACAGGGFAKEVQRPNILFVLADDMGRQDLGCYGSTFYETPRLDRLAKEGMRFTDAYAASPVCSPTRASILTGKYPVRVGITRATPQVSLALEEVTLATELSGRRTLQDASCSMTVRAREGFSGRTGWRELTHT